MKKIMLIYLITLMIFSEALSNEQAPIPLISITDSIFIGRVNITIKVPEDCWAVYYTTDGTDPDFAYNCSFTTDSTGIYINSPTTLKAFTVKKDIDNSVTNIYTSNIITINYTKKMSPPKTVPLDIEFLDSLSVNIITEEECTVFYTTDGSEPNTTSSQYTEPLLLTQTTTIKALAHKSECIDSEIGSFTFTKLE